MPSDSPLRRHTRDGFRPSMLTSVRIAESQPPRAADGVPQKCCARQSRCFVFIERRASCRKRLLSRITGTSARSKRARKVIVGANEFVVEEESPHILFIDESVARQQSAKLKTLRSRRSTDAVQRTLDALKKAAAQEPKAGSNGNASSANTMPYIVDAVRAYATVGEICEALRQVYGTYTEVSIT